MEYSYVEHKNNNYVVIKTACGKLTVVDKSTFEIIKNKNIIVKNNYIYANSRILHNLIAKHNTIQSLSDQATTIDHINRVSFDNRIENLRYATPYEQTLNKTRRSDRSELSKELNLPRCVTYIPESNNHGERFEISLNYLKRDYDNKNIKWKTASSKSLSLAYKYEEAKKFLRWILTLYPQLNELYSPDKYHNNSKQLINDYNEILQKSSFYCENDLIDITDKCNIEEDLSELTVEEKIAYHNLIFKLEDSVIENTAPRVKGKLRISKLPKDCGVTSDMIPQYCYYKPENKPRGDCFCIDKRHPLINKKCWTTTSSSGISTLEKFNQLLLKLETIKNNHEPSPSSTPPYTPSKTLYTPPASLPHPLPQSLPSPSGHSPSSLPL